MKRKLQTMALCMTTIISSAVLSAQDPMPRVFPGEQWETATPAEVGVNPEKLEEALKAFEAHTGDDGISEVVIVRHGRVIWRGDRADQVHHVWSCTKSFASMVTGLLFDDGKVTPETRIAEILPVYRDLYYDLTVHHMLTLTSGTSNQDAENLDDVKGPLFAPGTHFHYAPGLVILARALTKIAGEDLDELFRRRIARPIGLQTYQWGTVAEENDIPIQGFQGRLGQAVSISADEMARVGWLLLNGGKWDGKQLLSREWIETATRPQAGPETPLWDQEAWYKEIHGAYGYLFWVNGKLPSGERLWPMLPDATFAIQGNHNNICWVIPDWDMVVVRLGTARVPAGDPNGGFLRLLAEAVGADDGEAPEAGRLVADPKRVQALVPSREIIEVGMEAPLMRFNRHLRGGAHTWQSFQSGWQVPVTVAAMAGDEEAQARWLEQIRFSLEPENCLTTSGGYPAQHELILYGGYALTRLSPVLWNERLTEDERHKITLLMKAALVGSAFTTADASYAEGIIPTTLDGGRGFNRGWNPNFREGMFGQLIAATVFFGGTGAVNEILDSYDHDAFVRELREAKLANTLETFTFAEENPDSGAPGGDQITERIRNYRYQGDPLMEPMDLYTHLTRHTYGRTVNCGLNDGAGIVVDGVAHGVIVSGCDELPNRGNPGMLLELDGIDGSGPRSSITYAYGGFRPNQINLTLVLLGGYWQEGEVADELLALLEVGGTDLQYKLKHGYRSFHNGSAIREPTHLESPRWELSFRAILPYWEDHLKPYLQTLRR